MKKLLKKIINFFTGNKSVGINRNIESAYLVRSNVEPVNLREYNMEYFNLSDRNIQYFNK